MLATIGGILLTIGSFIVFALVTVFTFAVTLGIQLWNLGVQLYHAIAPHVVAWINQIS